MSNQRIFLVGPMGAGKSAVGRQLARQLNMHFADSDAWIEARTGVDIGFIFEKEGEAGFRRRESLAIEHLTQEADVVLATGGGAILDPVNRELLATRGTVVYLHASPAQQFERVRNSQHRPLLEHDDPRQVLDALFEVRGPLYASIADITVETDGNRVVNVVQEIVSQLRAS